MILEIILAAGCLAGLIIIIVKYHQLNVWLLSLRHAVPMMIQADDFEKLLSDLKKINLEQRLLIIQSITGGEIDVCLRMGSRHAIITGCARRGEDITLISQEDKSIG